MNGKRKGTLAEHRAMRLLEAAGYECMRSGGSLGRFDVIAWNPLGFRMLQVKAGGARCSPIERELMREAKLPPNSTREIWCFPDRCKEPSIEVL